MFVPAFSWGILLYENLYALNIVTGGDLNTTLNCRKHRLILGLMVRETRAVSLPACLPAYLPVNLPNLQYVRLLRHIDDQVSRIRSDYIYLFDREVSG